MKRAALIAVPIALALAVWFLLGSSRPTEAPPGEPPEAAPETAPPHAPPAGTSRGDKAPASAEPGTVWTLRLQVRTETGAPVEGARVRFLTGFRTGARTGKAGRAVLRLVGPGDLTICHPKREPALIRGLVPPPSGVEERLVTLGPGLEICGVVLDANGHPVDRRSGTLVQAVPVEAVPWHADILVFPEREDLLQFMDATDAEGRFRIPHLSPGEYLIRVVHIKGTLYAKPEQPVPARAGDEGVTVCLLHALCIALRLIDDRTGEPVKEHTTIYIAGTEARWVVGRHEGMVKLRDLYEKEMRLEVRVEGYDPVPPFEVTAARELPENQVEVRLKRSGPRLLLVVADGSGLPVEAVRLTYEFDHGEGLRGGGIYRKLRSPDGRYELPLGTGRWRIRVDDEEMDLVPIWIEFVMKADDRLVRHVVLKSGGAIRIPAEDIAVKGSEVGVQTVVMICGEDGERIPFLRRRRTKDKGLLFPLVPAGVVIVKWRDRRGNPAEKRVTIVAGETTEVRLD